MRGTKAKKLRNMVYGDGSRRIEREYEILTYRKPVRDNEGIRMVERYTFINKPGSLRWLYQEMKKYSRPERRPINV